MKNKDLLKLCMELDEHRIISVKYHNIPNHPMLDYYEIIHYDKFDNVVTVKIEVAELENQVSENIMSVNQGEWHSEDEGSEINIYCGGWFVTGVDKELLSDEAKYELGLPIEKIKTSGGKKCVAYLYRYGGIVDRAIIDENLPELAMKAFYDEGMWIIKEQDEIIIEEIK